MGDYTTILFARPSFLEGVARLADVGGMLNENNTSATPEQADTLALMADWTQVGQHVVAAAAQVRADAIKTRD